jgi:hypothetical protein
MPNTQSAYEWLKARSAEAVEDAEPVDAEAVVGEPVVAEPVVAEPVVEGPERERAARAEIDRLRGEIEQLVTDAADTTDSDSLGTAIDAVSRLQVVTANLDACNPPKGEHLGRALTELADRRLQGHADAIERGMTYTADNTLRLLRN